MKSPLPRALAALALAVLASAIYWSAHQPASESEEADTAAAPPRGFPQRLRETLAGQDPRQLTADEARELTELAKIHRQEIKRLIQTDPEQALQQAVSYADYHALPPEIQAHLERPFTEQGDYRILAICDQDPSTPETEISLRKSDGTYLEVHATRPGRLSTSRRGVPIQGIELDGHCVIRPSVLQPLEPIDQAWARANLPLANPDPNRDFSTAEAIEGAPVVALAGGYRFHFSSQETLAQLEAKLAALDARPHPEGGSAALLSQVRSESGSFSTASFFDEQKALPPPAATRDYLVIRVDFSDKPANPNSKENLESLVAGQVGPALRHYSYNKTTVALTVADTVYQLTESQNYYNINFMHDEAVAAYKADGHPDPFTEYDFVAVSFPQLGFAWAGRATVGGSQQWLQGKAASDTLLHELGHNYGLFHASYWEHDIADAGSVDPLNPNGETDDYGDIYDVMGSGEVAAGHFHMAAKHYLGWLENTGIETIDSSEGNGTYRVYAFDDVSATGIQALSIKRPGFSERYWLGVRQQYADIANLDKGAYLLWQRAESQNNRAWLIDTTPGSDNGRSDAGLAIGHTYADATAGVFITPIAAGRDATGKFLDVVVNLGAFPDNQAPTGTLAAATSGQARTPLSFAFSGSDPDGDPLSYFWDFGDGTVEENLASVEHSFPKGGTFTLTLTVSDSKGGSHSQQAIVEISDPLLQLTSRSSGTSKDLVALAANETVVVAGGGGSTLLLSNDGENWTPAAINSPSVNIRFSDIVWTGSEFIAAGMDYDFDAGDWRGAVYTSVDGTFWNLLYQKAEDTGYWGFTSLAYSPSQDTTVVLRNDAKIETRDAAGNWTTIDLGRPLAAWDGNPLIASVAWTGSHFVLGGYDQSDNQSAADKLMIYQSPDGLNWTNLAPESGFSESYGLSRVEYLGGMLLGSGHKSHIAYSQSQGESWFFGGLESTYRAEGIAYGKGVYSAFGLIDVPVDESQLETGEEDIPQNFLSTDGRRWYATGEPLAAYNDRIFFNDTFISVGDAGLIHQSAAFAAAPSPFQAWIVGYVSDAGSQGALANPDFDWAPNFMEFALGSDPSDSASVPTPPLLRRNLNGTISVSIPRFEKTEIVLSLEYSTDLASWGELPSSNTVDSAALLELTTSLAFDGSEPLFIRIKANQ